MLCVQVEAVAQQGMVVQEVPVAQEGLKMVFPPLVVQVDKQEPAHKLGD
jgi:hypothetical protein